MLDNTTEFDFENRIISTEYNPHFDDEKENALRPKNLDEYFGQEKVKEQLKIYIESAKQRGDTLDHILLYGPPGLGKTTLSCIVANEMNVNIRITSGPAIERPGDLVSLLTNLQEGDILFIDEIHRIPRAAEELLYPAMEDFCVDIMTGKGPSASSLHMSLKKFTLIGATTRAGQLTTPLRDRFGILERLELYSPEELAQIVKRSADILHVAISEDGALEIAKRSRGTPRIANRLLKRLRDFALIKGNGVIDASLADTALRSLDIDELGLDNIDRLMLKTIIDVYHGGPVGIETLAATIGEETITLEDVYEPYLLQIGFISRTPRGRYVTEKAYYHLGIPFQNQGQLTFEQINL